MFELNLQRAIVKDRYEIRGRISSGSYAEVFVARDRDSGNAAVIKALNSRLQGIPPPELEQMLGEKFQSESQLSTKNGRPKSEWPFWRRVASLKSTGVQEANECYGRGRRLDMKMRYPS